MRALPPFFLLLAVKPIPDTYQSDQADYYLRYKAYGFFYIRYHVFTSLLLFLQKLGLPEYSGRPLAYFFDNSVNPS